MDIFEQAATRIIKSQEGIVGPLAFEQAKKVKGLEVGSSEEDIHVTGNKKEVLNNLVKQYEGLFGRASVEVCRSATRSLFSNTPKDQVPPLLA